MNHTIQRFALPVASAIVMILAIIALALGQPHPGIGATLDEAPVTEPTVEIVTEPVTEPEPEPVEVTEPEPETRPIPYEGDRGPIYPDTSLYLDGADARKILARTWKDLLATLPPCEHEDSANCAWNAGERGNGIGESFIDLDGVAYYSGMKRG